MALYNGNSGLYSGYSGLARSTGLYSGASGLAGGTSATVSITFQALIPGYGYANTATPARQALIPGGTYINAKG